VRLGQGGNGHQVVMDGLEKGEKVVIEGNLMLERLVASKD
jgi:hypothetical protein